MGTLNPPGLRGSGLFLSYRLLDHSLHNGSFRVSTELLKVRAKGKGSERKKWEWKRQEEECEKHL